MGTHLRVFSESYLMSTILAGFRWFSKVFAYLCFDEISLIIRRVKSFIIVTNIVENKLEFLEN